MVNEALLLAQNKQLRERNEELEETVRQLRETSARPIQFPDWVPHLTPLEESVLVLMCRRDVLNSSALSNIVHEGEARVPNLLTVIVCRLRKKLSPHGVEIRNVWGKGYRLTDASKGALMPTHEALAA